MMNVLSFKIIITLSVFFSYECGIVKRNFPIDFQDQLYNDLDYFLNQRTAAERLQPEQQVPVRTTTRPVQVKDWPKQKLKLGQVSGVAVNQQNNPVIFHRGPHIFNQTSFDKNHHYRNTGAIDVDTILELSAKDGSIIRSFGKNRFYLPHGIHIDKDGNIWVTDVALHQVMKFPVQSDEPSLVMGEAFIPGSDENHFCKPTSVAVTSSGEFFVSDGYCNSRILKYSPNGKLLVEWGHSGVRSIFAVPHSMALIEDMDLICIADRENKKIPCFTSGLDPSKGTGQFTHAVSTSQLGKVYSIAYGGDGILYGTAVDSKGTGFTVDIESTEILNTWNLSGEKSFQVPHEIGVSMDGSSLYVAEISLNTVTKFNLQ